MLLGVHYMAVLALTKNLKRITFELENCLAPAP